jgi:predicted NBD/HSP70 family sugar kinase
MTRAQIAVRTGISKTTISESMRRLGEVGLVVDTGERTSGRGRSGSYYSLADGCGLALVASISPAGVVAEAVEPGGVVADRIELALDRSAGKERAAEVLRAAVSRVCDGQAGGVRAAVVSVADPVDRRSGRLVQLPDAPFLVGDLDAVALLGPFVQGEVLVDNDVNWAAQAERQFGCAGDVDDFVYLHLGEGLGCAVVSDGEVRRGHSGVAGEVAHVVTRGVNGTAVAFTQVFADLGLRQARSTAVDVAAVRAVLDAAKRDPRAASRVGVLADAVSGVLLAAVGYTDPERIVLGGSWGRLLAFTEALDARARNWPRSLPVVASALDEAADLRGARSRAVELVQSAIVAASHQDKATGARTPGTRISPPA